jgi:hypothetical protein
LGSIPKRSNQVFLFDLNFVSGIGLIQIFQQKRDSKHKVFIKTELRKLRICWQKQFVETHLAQTTRRISLCSLTPNPGLIPPLSKFQLSLARLRPLKSYAPVPLGQFISSCVPKCLARACQILNCVRVCCCCCFCPFSSLHAIRPPRKSKARLAIPKRGPTQSFAKFKKVFAAARARARSARQSCTIEDGGGRTRLEFLSSDIKIPFVLQHLMDDVS